VEETALTDKRSPSADAGPRFDSGTPALEPAALVPKPTSARRQDPYTGVDVPAYRTASRRRAGVLPPDRKERQGWVGCQRRLLRRAGQHSTPTDTGITPHSEGREEPSVSDGRDALPARRRALQIPALVARWERHRRPVPGHWDTEAGAPSGCLSSPADLMPRER